MGPPFPERGILIKRSTPLKILCCYCPKGLSALYVSREPPRRRGERAVNIVFQSAHSKKGNLNFGAQMTFREINDLHAKKNESMSIFDSNDLKSIFIFARKIQKKGNFKFILRQIP